MPLSFILMAKSFHVHCILFVAEISLNAVDSKHNLASDQTAAKKKNCFETIFLGLSTCFVG